MQQKKCPGCGAAVKIDEKGGQIQKCQYCGSVLTEEIIKEEIIKEETRQEPKATFTINRQIKSRPKFSILIFIILLVAAWPFAILYAIMVSYSQSEWDKNNKNDNNR